MMQDLIEAYKNTSYNIFKPEISLKIGKSNSDLDDLLENYNCTEWAFITAYNPFSNILSDEENWERHKQLKENLREYCCFEGEGVGDDPSWNPERSFLILGISEEDAVDLGEKFQQNAIVVGELKQVARLVLLKDAGNKGHSST